MRHEPRLRWRLEPIHRLDDCIAVWDRLANTDTTAPFLASGFMRPLLREFGKGGEKLAIATEGEDIVGCAILAPDGAGRWTTFQPSQLPTGAIVLAPRLAINAAAEALARRMSLACLSLGFTQLDTRRYPAPAESSRLACSPYIQTAWVDVQESFDSYWEARGKNLRQNMRKQRRKLQDDGIAVSLETITRPDAVAGALADYGRLESAGWKAGRGTAIHPDNAQGRFYRTMLEDFCTSGRGRIYRYRFGDSVVAIDLCVESADTLVVLKTTYDESIKTLSPAFLMREEAFQQLWAEGRIRRIEFFGKLMDWHKRWTDNARDLYHLTHYRWGWLKVWRERVRAQSVATKNIANSEPN